MIRAFLVATVLLTATVALSAPVDFDGSGDHRVVISAAGVKAAGAVVAHGDMLEIPLAATDASAHVDADDATVKHIDLIGGAHARLIVRLHHSKHTTERIAAATIAQDANGSLKLIIPRQPSGSAPVATAAAVAAAPVATTPVAPAAEAAAIAAPVAKTPSAKSEAKPEAKLEAKPDAKIDAKSEAKTPAIAIVPAEQLGIPVAKEQVSTDSLLDDHKANPRTAWWVLLTLIIGVPALLFAQKRRGGGKVQEPLLKVLASQSLGGKAKLMIVEADGKRILLAVNDQTTRVVANLEAAVAAVGADNGRDHEADGNDEDLDFPIDEAPARAEASFREPTSQHPIHHVETSRSDSAVVHLTSTATSIPTVSTVSTSSNSAIAGLLKLRADANASHANNDGSNGPTEWGDALRRAVGRVKS